MRKKLNQKGFTMVEILVAFVILAIIAAIAIPVGSNLVKNTTKQYYKTLEDSVKTAGMDYYSDYRSERPLINYATSEITLDSLLEKNYIKDVVDSKGNATCSGYVRIFKEKEGEYQYKSCLVCENYQTSGQVCGNDYDPDNNGSIYTLEAPKKVYSYINKGIDVSRLEKATIKARGTAIGKVTAIPSSFADVDVNKVGVYPQKIEYEYEAEGEQLKANSDLEIYQNPAPKVDMANCISDNNCNVGPYTSGTLTSYNVKETIQAADYVYGTFDRMQTYNIVTEKWNDLCTDKTCIRFTRANEGDSTWITKRVRSIDTDGNPSAEAEYIIKIDKTGPSCGLKITSGTLGDNKWYRSDIGIGFSSMSDVSGVVSRYGLSLSTTPSYGNQTYTYQSEGEGTVYGHVEDEAGNKGSCSIKVQKDTKAPTISTFTVASSTTGYHSLKTKLTIKATDSTSGVSEIYVSNTGYEKDGSWETYTTSKDWTLSGSYDGEARTVYLAVKDKAGNISHKSVATYAPYKNCTTTTTTWSGTWSTCSVTCGTGTQTMSGTLKDSYTGASCGTTSKSQTCTQPACNQPHTHEYGIRYNSISATYKNYRKSTYYWTGTWTCTSGHTHWATPTLVGYELQCIHCGKTYYEINPTEKKKYWCPCDVPGLGCQFA